MKNAAARLIASRRQANKILIKFKFLRFIEFDKLLNEVSKDALSTSFFSFY